MKKIFLGLFLLVPLMLASIPVLAYQRQSCTPEAIGLAADGLISDYETARAAAKDTKAAVDALGQLQTALAQLQQTCANAAASSSGGTASSPGSGTKNDPYAFGVAGDTGEGFTLKLTGFIGNGDRIIHNENMFNDVPQKDEVYVILSLELACAQTTRTSCEAQDFNFRLVGDDGIIYEVPIEVYKDMLDIKVLGGTTATGNLPFIVKKDDTNLRLMYSNSLFYDNDEVYYNAEPSLDQGVQITVASSVNIRSGPGTNFAVAGSLSANTPVIAFGRNSDGTWLQTANGWVATKLVTAESDVMTLPVTAQ
jgi:SH3 domain-containing protein